MSWSTGKGPDIVNGTGRELERLVRLHTRVVQVLAVDPENSIVRVIAPDARMPGSYGRPLPYLPRRFGVAMPRVDEFGEEWDFEHGLVVYVQAEYVRAGTQPPVRAVYRFALEQHPNITREWVEGPVQEAPVQPREVLTGPQRIEIMQRQLKALGYLPRIPSPGADFDGETVRAINDAVRRTTITANTAQLRMVIHAFPFTPGTLRASAAWCETAGVCHFRSPDEWAAAQRTAHPELIARPLMTPAQGDAIVAIALVDQIYRDARHIGGHWIEAPRPSLPSQP